MQRGHWGAPSVMAALAGFVHDRESTANYERNNDNDAYNAAGLNCWRINRKIGHNRRQLIVHLRVERARAGRLAFNRLQLPDQCEQFGGKFFGNLVVISQALANLFRDERPGKAPIEWVRLIECLRL
jgi:hypothetical protein